MTAPTNPTTPMIQCLLEADIQWSPRATTSPFGCIPCGMLCEAWGFCKGAATPADGSSCSDALAARSSSSKRLCFAILAAAPARPAATFFGSFFLEVAGCGAIVSSVTRSTDR